MHDHDRRDRGRHRADVRAWAVLAAALGSAAVLAGAAFTATADPALAGQATLARLAGTVADGVVAEWERLRLAPLPFGAEPSPEGATLRWSADAEPGSTPGAEPRAPGLDLPHEANPVVDALLAEANRRAAQGERGEARALLADALARPLDAQRRAELGLRALQLAQQDGDDEATRAVWHSVWDETEPERARAGTSVLLLATLAAAPALPLEERAQARDRLVGLWARGALALPPEELPSDPGALRAALVEPAPLAAELRRRLQALLPEAAPDERLVRLERAERGRTLESVFGPLPVPDGQRAWLASAPAGELLYRRRAAPAAGTVELEGVLLAPGTARARLLAAVARNELLPPDFALDFGGPSAEPGVLVRATTPLTGSPLAFAVRHADPERVQSEVGRRQAWTRGALVVLAVLVAAAGLSTFRALRRERRLADLRSAFVASVSHELRTPVASILLLAENLERGRVADEASRQRYHGLLRREAERLRGLVEDVLDAARVERGERRAEPLEALDAALLAQDLEAAARERVAREGGTLECRIAGLPARVSGDAESLRRALLNLVENALRHSGSRDLDLAMVGDGAGGLVIRLRDHGRGIAPGARARIFEPFERLEHPEAAPGTGLGLAIVRDVARHHGGDVQALSPDEGPGAVFEIHLPRAGDGGSAAR